MPRSFLLIGDSHSGPIRDAALERSVDFVGGPIGIGKALNDDFFDRTDGDLVFRDPETDARYRSYLAELGLTRIADLEQPLVSTIGFNVQRIAGPDLWSGYCIGRPQPDQLFLTAATFEVGVASIARGALAFYEYLAALGVRVFAVMPPQRPARAEFDFFLAGQEILFRFISARGAEIIDVRAEAVGADGLQKPEYCSPHDRAHGNTAFGHLILERLIEIGVANAEA